MRLGDADRERMYEILSTHHAAGRIGIEELERRIAAVAGAQTREEAATVLADLPPLERVSPERRPRWRKGHGDADAPQPDWHPTKERFRDPRSDLVMRVWVDSGGGRHYVVDEEL